MFDNTEKLTIHQKSHKELPCKYCSKTFNSNGVLHKHTRLTHENFVKCNACAKIFSDNEKCRTHQMECSKNECMRGTT